MDYKASGSITNTEGKKLYESLQKRISELKGRPRLYGFDITVETDEIEIYINSYDDMEFNFDISSSNFQVLSN